MNGRGGNYSLGRLFEFLNALGRDVEIAVRPKRRESPARPHERGTTVGGALKQYGLNVDLDADGCVLGFDSTTRPSALTCPH